MILVGKGIWCFRSSSGGGAMASLTPKSGVTYTDGIADLDAATVSVFGQAISNNSAITNTTTTVYVDFGELHRKINVGHQVTPMLNGTAYAFDIIGFNHDTLTDAAAYGAATATGKAGFTFQMHDLFSTTYKMYSTSNNNGGWKSCLMRTSTMPAMKSYMPPDLQSVIKPVNKVSSTGGGSSSGTETVSDNCFLLAEIEIFGIRTNSVSGEGTQYAYYRAGNSKIKGRSGSAYYWWERSTYSGYNSRVCCVNRDGTAYYNDSAGALGVAFGFCI